MKSHPCSLLLLVGHSVRIVALCLQIIMDGPRTFWPSDSVLPGPSIIQQNISVVHNGQLKHSNLSASIVDIQLKISQLNFRLRKTFSKFYRRYYDLISKFQVGLKSLLRQGLSEPDFYGDLVYKLKKIVGSNNFSAQFIKIISHYKKIGYNINVLQQTACLVVNPITVGNFAFLFNCTLVGRTSDSIMVLT